MVTLDGLAQARHLALVPPSYPLCHQTTYSLKCACACRIPQPPKLARVFACVPPCNCWSPVAPGVVARGRTGGPSHLLHKPADQPLFVG